MASISQSIENACQIIGKTSMSARIDSEVLMCHVLQCNSAHLAAWPEKMLNSNEDGHFIALVQKRCSGIPIAHLTGEKEFWSLNFKVSQDTLIPRPETELLVETMLTMFQHEKQLDIVDLGTGSGAIAIALASTKPEWNMTATDISAKALAMSKENASLHNINNIRFINSDWFQSLNNQKFDVVISNPPYIAKSDAHLRKGDLRFEPQCALASGNIGMDDILKITGQSVSHLHNNGWLFLEHGYDQKTLVFDCLKNAGFTQITQKNDLAGNPRLTIGQYQHTSNG